MSFNLPQPPLQTEPLSEEGLFVPPWGGWLKDLWKLLKQTTNATSASITFSGSQTSSFTLSVNITVPPYTTLYISTLGLQTWVAAAPTWQWQVKIDSLVLFDSGTVTTWQQVVGVTVPTYGSATSGGAHTVTVTWTAGNANASLLQANIIVIPIITQ